jgi:hypothetical protein
VVWLRFQEPPGLHLIVFRAEGVAYLQAKLLVEVRQCWKGEQQERLGVCQVCPAGSYNFGPGLCEDCPANAECAGGSAVLSKPGFWLSSPKHNAVDRWVCALCQTRYVQHCLLTRPSGDTPAAVLCYQAAVLTLR